MAEYRWMKNISRRGGRAPGTGFPPSTKAPPDDGECVNGDLYRALFEQSRDSLLMLKFPPGGVPVIVDANMAALGLHGYSRGELVGKPVTILGGSLNRRRLSLPKNGGSAVFEVRQKRRDGTQLITEVTSRSISYGSGVYGVLAERDVTGRRRQEDEGRRVSGRIMLAREDEKKRLAASLHDAIGAMQVGLSSSLLVIEEEVRLGESRRAFASIQRARKLLKKMTSAVKSACVESWPPALAVSGLDAVLHELLNGFTGRTDIEVKADIRLPGAERASENPLAIVLYRLAQEALMNAEKHSRAAKIEFSACRENGWMTLSVRDDGRGFDLAAIKNKKSCLGLKMMADAAETAGGHFSVYSKPGAGTLLKAELPLSPEQVPVL